MANTSQKLVDSERRVVYKWTGNSAEPAVLKIDAGALNFSLNANNQLLGSGTDRKTTYRLSLKKVIYDVAAGQAGNGYVELYWTGTPNQTLITLSGQGQMDFAEGGDGIIIFNNASGANSNGNVGLQTVNFATTGCSYTIIADFRKHSEDYSTFDRN